MFIDDLTADRSSRINCEMYRAILCSGSAKCCKTDGWCYTEGMENDPKHTEKPTPEFLTTKKWEILQWTRQPADLPPTEHAV